MKAQRLLAVVLFASLLMGSGPGAAHAAAHAAAFAAGARAPESASLETSGAPDERTASDAPSGWWAAVQEDIRCSEYHITWQEQTYLSDVPAAYQAPNRANNLRTYFVPRGIRLLPRAGETQAWEWGLALAGYGYEGAVQPVSDAEQIVSGNRIEYRRAGLIEWYVNDEQGLEQGFTLASRPPGAHSRAPLQIEMTLTGSLIPALEDDGTAIAFTTPDGARVLRYGTLYAYDAVGRPLPAHLDLVSPDRATQSKKQEEKHTKHALRITLDDAHAAYPITIDPLVTSPGWTAEGDQAGAYHGASVSTAGDVNGDGYDDVIVGAPGYDGGQRDTGRALVYLGSASGLSASAAWTAQSDEQGAQFGSSVDSAGDVNGNGYDDVIVGAIASGSDLWMEGRAYVYHGSASGLEATAAWTAQGGQVAARFGSSVSSAGDVNGDGYDDVIVGALGQHDGLTNVGRAYVYHGSASGLSVPANWSIQGGESGTRLGASVDTAGDVNGDGYDDVIIGAPGIDDQIPITGRAYVYHGSAAGLDASSPDWTGTSGRADDRFGASVSAAGDVDGDGYDDIIVGAPGGDEENPTMGQVYLFRGSLTGLSTGSADWAATSDQADDGFGVSVSAAGDVNGDGYDDILIGAPRYDGDQVNEGQALIYRGSAPGPRATPDWTMQGDQNDAWFGASVSAAGDVNGDGYADVLVGAPYTDGGQQNAGRAFLYYGPAPALDTTPDWTAEGDTQGAWFGFAADAGGDVNGDGYGDVVVGAPFYDAGNGGEGRAYLYHGSSTGLSGAPAWTVEGDQAKAYLGTAVGKAGDVNGDGYDDIIVGADGYGSVQKNQGRAFLYYGSASGLNATADWWAESGQAGAQFGQPVGTAGDVNGDGYADVLVGARYYDGGQEDEGRVYVYYGSASGLNATANWTAESDQAGAEYGRAASTAGDVNGDGYTDLVVGAPFYDGGQTDGGRAYVYYGSSSGLDAAGWTVEGDQARAEYGRAVSTAGDVDGDGYADVIIGAPRYDGDLPDEGRAYVYYGSATGLSAGAPGWTANGDQAGARFGRVVGAGGDINGDGYADVVIGAPYFDTVHMDEGRIFAYYGGPMGLTTGSPDWAAGSGQPGANLGACISTAGDVNGDGYADLIAGAPLYDNGQADEGRVYVYYGPVLGQGALHEWTAAGEPYVEYSWDWFGKSVDTAGDVNGDGYADVIVSAPGYDGGLDNQGRIHLYLGAVSGLRTTAHWMATGEHENGWFGISVGAAGDVNGDGYADVIAGEVGTPFGNDPFKGRAYVYYGSSTGLGTTPAWRVEDDRVGTRFGRAVSTAGDVNGDGYADVVVGAPDADTDKQDAGRAYLYLGSLSGLSTAPAWTAEGAIENAKLGQSVGAAGDVNGDGYADLVVGAPGVSYASSNVHGWAYAYHGSPSGLGAVATWAVQHEQVGALFGASVGTAGDVNGDGYADVIVGAPDYDAPAGDGSEGQALVYHGSPAGLRTTSNWTANGSRGGDKLGSSVGAAGDVNGDGYADIVVGAPNDWGFEGRAFLYRGSPAGLMAAPAESTTDDQSESYYGDSVSTAGDINGDGYADVVVGAPGGARAHVRYGSGSALSFAPQQRRLDNSAPVAHLGQVESNAFRLAALGRTPFGRGKVKLEWEVKPLGAPFDGLGTGQSAAWTDTGTLGAQLDERVTGLQPYAAYHWRVRLRYHPATTPFQQYSRWLTIPRKSWNEQDLRTGAPAVAFARAAYSAPEGAGAATIAVALSAPSALTVTVRYATSDGTARAGTDYTATSGTLTFAPGQTMRAFDVPIRDDDAREADETVVLELSDAVNAVIGAANPATLVLVDDDTFVLYLPLISNRSLPAP